MLYLAVPDEAYQSLFSLEFVRLSIEQNQVWLIVYDPEQKEILKWTR